MVKCGIVWRRWKHALGGYWASGLYWAEYCRRHDLNPKVAYRWRKRLRPASSTSDGSLEIVPLLPPALPAAASTIASGFGVMLELGLIHIRLFDVETLRRVLMVLEVR